MIDILLATYNGENYIAQQLDSILNQTVTDFQILVRDDGSQDHTVSILKEYERRYPGKVNICENESPTGSAKKNFFRLTKDSTQPYAMFCDQDDIWNPDKIEVTLKEMQKLEQEAGAELPLLVHTDLAVADTEGKIIAESFRRFMNLSSEAKVNRLMIQNHITGCTMMVNHTLIQMMQQVADTDSVLMHDHWAGLIAVIFGKIGYLDCATMRYRQHGNNSVGAKNAKSLGYLAERWRRGKKSFRKDLSDSMRQIKYFLNVYSSVDMKEEFYQLLTAYAGLEAKGKLQRIRYYIGKRVLKHGVIRCMMQLIWG